MEREPRTRTQQLRTARYIDSKGALIEVTTFRIAHLDAAIRKVLAPAV